MKSENQRFSERLNLALDARGFPPKGKGRQLQLAQVFSVSSESARKWLEGKSFPDTKRIPEIAKHLKINAQWLLAGTGHMSPVAVVKDLPSNESPNWSQVPILSWEEAGDFKKVIAKLPKTRERAWADVELGPNAYALIIDEEDDSMEPRYRPGSILVIDPDYAPSHKHIVIYQLKGQKRVTCKQLLIDGDIYYLKPHNAEYQTLIAKKGDKYCGSIRQVRMKY